MSALQRCRGRRFLSIWPGLRVVLSLGYCHFGMRPLAASGSDANSPNSNLKEQHMSESSPADTNAEPSPVGDDTNSVPPPAKPGGDAAKPESGSTQKVSEDAQEDAAKDRKEGGGYT